VCLLDVPADELWMQNVAAELNLAETAFVHPGPEGCNLRWFFPDSRSGPVRARNPRRRARAVGDGTTDRA
jgi:hypothetical protein